MAVARRGLDRRTHDVLLRAFRADLVLLVFPHAVARGGLVLGGGDKTSMVAGSASWLRRGGNLLLGRLLLAAYRDGPRPDSGRIIYGRLFCHLELASWPGASPHVVAR